MDLQQIDIVKVLRTPLELNAKAGDKILIITDTKMEPGLWQGLATAANMMGMEPTIAVMTPRESHAMDPAASICAAALDPGSDLVIYLTSTAMAHAPITEALILAGKRFILMEELTSAMLGPDGPASADYYAINELGLKVAAAFSAGNDIRVTCANGTDLTARINGREGRSVAGIPLKMRDTGGGGCAFPDGESHVCPVEGTGEGRIVFDLTAHSVGKLTEPLILTVESGMVTRIEGGQQAESWRRIFQQHGDANSYNCPAEIAVGLNPKVVPTGVMRTDKKMYGAVHIGVGDTIALGGTCHAKLRLEGVISKPTVTVDGREIVRAGSILLD